MTHLATASCYAAMICHALLEAKFGPVGLPANLGRTDSDTAEGHGEPGEEKLSDSRQSFTAFVTQTSGFASAYALAQP